MTFKELMLVFLGGVMAVAFWAVVGYAIDATASLLVMWALESVHVATSFWSASVVANALEFIVIAGTYIGVKVAK